MWEPGEGGCGEGSRCSPIARPVQRAVGWDKAKPEEVLSSSFVAHHKSQLATGKPPSFSAPATLILQCRKRRPAAWSIQTRLDTKSGRALVQWQKIKTPHHDDQAARLCLCEIRSVAEATADFAAKTSRSVHRHCQG